MTELIRDNKFSYVCNRCGSCCTNRRIPVGAYDVLRLSRNRNISTTEFINSFVQLDAEALTRQSDGSCIFFKAGSCSVHSDRPLACRLYPLARNQTVSGKERFVILPPEETSTGARGNSGTISEYLQTQDIEPYVTFADRFLEFGSRLLAAFKSRAQGNERIKDLVMEDLSFNAQMRSTPERTAMLRELLDIDALSGDSTASNIEEKTERYFAAVELRLAGLN